MSENPLVTLSNRTVKAIIAQTLKARRIDDDKFESNISMLIADADPNITEALADEILLQYRVKIACDLTICPEERFLVATYRTCRSFEPLKKHLFRIKKCKSVFEINILDLSSLAILEQNQEKLNALLDAFTEPKTGFVRTNRAAISMFGNEIQRGHAPVYLREAALHGSLRRLECDYGESPFAKRPRSREK